mmetsp:Transcript_31543/g.79634  ORF Transcript_31543/g.79634 Transcript_31543/m.79634 type:complete len:248 (-) Transcript_31543:116-859(-)
MPKVTQFKRMKTAMQPSKATDVTIFVKASALPVVNSFDSLAKNLPVGQRLLIDILRGGSIPTEDKLNLLGHGWSPSTRFLGLDAASEMDAQVLQLSSANESRPKSGLSSPSASGEPTSLSFKPLHKLSCRPPRGSCSTSGNARGVRGGLGCGGAHPGEEACAAGRKNVLAAESAESDAHVRHCREGPGVACLQSSPKPPCGEDHAVETMSLPSSSRNWPRACFISSASRASRSAATSFVTIAISPES